MSAMWLLNLQPSSFNPSPSPFLPKSISPAEWFARTTAGNSLLGSSFFEGIGGIHKNLLRSVGNPKFGEIHGSLHPHFISCIFFFTQKPFTQTILRDGSTSASFKQTDLLWLQLRSVQNSYEIHYTDWFIRILKMASLTGWYNHLYTANN